MRACNQTRDKEFLYQHDTGLARVRRLFFKEAEAQLSAVAAHNENAYGSCRVGYVIKRRADHTMGSISLSEKRLVITGGARGLGRAFVEAAIKAGARVVVADILEDLGRQTVKKLSRLGKYILKVLILVTLAASQRSRKDQLINLVASTA